MSKGTFDLVFRFHLKPGMEERYEKATTYILERTQEEPYVLEYSIHRSADGASYTQHERYADEEAMWRHLEVTQQGQAEWAEATQVEEVNVLGEPSERFWDTFGGNGPRVFAPFRKVNR
ncbi:MULTISPECIES: antibiotic biosynthesis monooxygenase [unclassified Streptomyces]|uniref:putative quinol monooxygenase n=1 Tax=unclassified Streptomyces TaxID=2593676 RepID=UPI00342BFAAF